MDIIKKGGRIIGALGGIAVGTVGAVAKSAYSLVATDKSLNEIANDAGKLIDDCGWSGADQGEEHADVIAGTIIGYGLNQQQDKKRKKLEEEKAKNKKA